MTTGLHCLRFPKPGTPAVVILHGLLGSSRNWMTIGKALAERFDVHALDLRNHGLSPHHSSMEWPELCADVAAHLDRENLGGVTLLGHSLGGKVAMRLACQEPERVGRLIVVDIAAKAYPPYHLGEFEAMRRIPLDRIASRKEAEDVLAESISDWAMRQFLLTNLARTENGAFRWQIHLDAIDAALPSLAANSLQPGMRYEGPSLLIAGGRSSFLEAGDAEAMQTNHLPCLQVKRLPRAGHNVHIDDRSGFLEAVQGFLSQ